jgi:hypothetical protein
MTHLKERNMDERGKRSLKSASILTFIFCLAISASVCAQTAEDYFQLGKANLENSQLALANDDFKQALLLDPNHEGANLYYALTRLAIISQSSSLNTLLDRAGVNPSGRDIFNWTADFTKDPTGKILLPSNAPTGAELQSYLKTDILPEVNGALNNLSKVSISYETTFKWLTGSGTGTISSPNALTDAAQSWINNEFGGFRIVVAGKEYIIVSNTSTTITVTPDWSIPPGNYGYKIFEPINIDYGDVLVFKGSLTLAKAGIYIVTAYNLDMDNDVLLSLYNAGTLNIQSDIIDAYPQLLTLLPDQQLPQAKLILKEAVSILTSAIDYIVNETHPQDHELFIIDDPKLESDFRSILSDLDISLDRSNYIYVTYVNLSEFFDNPKTLRNYFPHFIKMNGQKIWIQPNSFPDPTLGGILPGLKAERVDQWLWNWILYPESLAWTTVDPPSLSSSWGLKGIHLTSSSEGWAVGSDYTNHKGVLLHLNGTWTSVDPPSVSSNWDLRGIYFTSATEGWAVGSDYTNHKGVLLHYLSGTWTSVDPPSVSSNWDLKGIYFTSATEGWGVGRDNTNRKGVLLHYLNGSWSSVAPPSVSTDWELNGVHFTSATEGWGVGNDWSNLIGVTLHYSNGNWTSVTFPGSAYSYIPMFNGLSAVGFTSPNTGWAVGDNYDAGNILFQYADGRWARVEPPPHGPKSLTSVHFHSSNEGWAVGIEKDVVLHYSGGSWRSIKLLGLNKGGVYYFSPYFTGVHFASPYEGWIVGADYQGKGVLLKYSTPAPGTHSKIGIFKNGQWNLDMNDNGIWDGCATDLCFAYGLASDIPLMGDWNGDGIKTPGVYRPSTSQFFLKNSNTTGVADIKFTYGIPGDIPVVGDWNKNGYDSIGVYRPSKSKFFLKNSNMAGVADIVVQYGIPGDIPVVGDWTGKGYDSIGVYRPSKSKFFLRNSNTTGVANTVVQYGAPGDIPIVGDWNGDGMDTVGVYRPPNGKFYLRNSNSAGVADWVKNFGIVNGHPLVGR